MAKPKQQTSPPNAIGEFAALFRLASHPIRATVVLALNGGPVDNPGIERATGGGKGVVNQYLILLQGAGLVESRRAGVSSSLHTLTDRGRWLAGAIEAFVDQVAGSFREDFCGHIEE